MTSFRSSASAYAWSKLEWKDFSVVLVGPFTLTTPFLLAFLRDRRTGWAFAICKSLHPISKATPSPYGFSLESFWVCVFLTWFPVMCAVCYLLLYSPTTISSCFCLYTCVFFHVSTMDRGCLSWEVIALWFCSHLDQGLLGNELLHG